MGAPGGFLPFDRTPGIEGPVNFGAGPGQKTLKLGKGQFFKFLFLAHGITDQTADRLGISPAYLNLIENDRRPLPAHVLIALAQTFSIDLAAFAADDSGQLSSELLEVFGDPIFEGSELGTVEVRELAQSQPALDPNLQIQTALPEPDEDEPVQ